MITSRWLLMVGLVGMAACSKPASNAAKAGDSSRTGGMTMGNMPMDIKSTQMMGTMRGHMDSIAQMSPDQMRGMMATHENMTSQMMDAMGADMRAMHVTPDSAWTALSDSVRSDLAELPGLSGEALETRMQAHADRMQRLMAMHQRMMGR